MKYEIMNRAIAPSALQVLFQSAGTSFANAARLLAGKQGERLVDDIVAALARAPAPDRRTLRNLVQLHRILSLDAISDRGSEVMEDLFMLIDPGDPVVEDICLLADNLIHALRNYAAHHPAVDLDIAA